MTWTAVDPEEKETIFQSGATTQTEIAIDLKTVVDRMIENREEDNAAAAEQLLFSVNATNGFIKILWWNEEASEVVGDWVYELQLETYWESEEDSSIFDETCRYALFHFTEDYMLGDDENPIYDIFLKTELCEIEHVLV